MRVTEVCEFEEAARAAVATAVRIIEEESLSTTEKPDERAMALRKILLAMKNAHEAFICVASINN